MTIHYGFFPILSMYSDPSGTNNYQIQHTTLLLALPAERMRQVLRFQVVSSEKKVQVVFVISLNVSVIPSN